MLTSAERNKLVPIIRNTPDKRIDKIYDDAFINKYRNLQYVKSTKDNFLNLVEPLIKKYIEQEQITKLMNIVHFSFNDIVGTPIYEEAKNFLIQKNIYNFRLQYTYFKIDLYNDLQIECKDR